MPDPNKTTGRWTYIKLLILAKLFRGGFILASKISQISGNRTAFPPGVRSETLIIPSSKSRRRITLTVYKNSAAIEAEKAGNPSAVHIHFYGGGWLLVHTTGQTNPLIANLLAGIFIPLTVVDATYALSPENPCPAELEDARDIYDYIHAHPDKWDKDHVTLSGASAGGAIALGLAVTLGKESRDAGQPLHSHPIKAVVVYYALTNWVTIHEHKAAFLASLPADPPDVMPDFVMDTIQAAHFFSPGGLSEEEDSKRKAALERDPSVSPALANLQDFPPRVGIWTAQWDVMSAAADELRDRLKGTEGEETGRVRVSGQMVMGVGHGWDGFVREGQIGWDEKVEAYNDLVEAVGWAGKVHKE